MKAIRTLTMIIPLALATSVPAAEVCAENPIAIPDDLAGGVTIMLTADLPGELVEGLEVDLDLLHPWVGDLVVTLESPGGTLATLLDRPGIPSEGFPGPFGCGGANILASFADGASQAAESMCSTTGDPVISGQVGPGTPLGVFGGEIASGVWKLTVSDRSVYDTGVLNSVCLRITGAPACSADLTRDGQLDVFDVFAYLDLYVAQDPIADFTGDGAWDVFDVFAFLDAFNAGCP